MWKLVICLQEERSYLRPLKIEALDFETILNKKDFNLLQFLARNNFIFPLRESSQVKQI